ncbi:hypothetical protein ACEYW6_00200 [Nostoc sp. UIC 10607]|uniref:hypothetical protein n=1 Tax=Nostoc sp. UIC 10607 TaxID=3045935 RepID=UPI0039A2C92D
MSQNKDLNKTIQDFTQLATKIQQMRQQYKNLVHQYYNSNNPFIAGRKNSDEEVKKDITNMDTIVIYSIIAGDLDIIKTWVIEPINNGKVSMLADYKNLKRYISLLNSLKTNNPTDIQNYYFELIEKALKQRL